MSASLVDDVDGVDWDTQPYDAPSRIACVVAGYIINGLDTGGTAEELRHRVHRFADSNQNQPNWYSLSAFEADAIVASIFTYHETQPGGTVGSPRVPVETQTTALRRSDPGTTLPPDAFPLAAHGGTVSPPRVPDVIQTTALRRSDPGTTLPSDAFPLAAHGGTVGPPRVPVETQTTTTRRSDPDTTVPHVAFPQSVTEGSKRRRVQTVEEKPSVEEKEHVEKDTGR